MNLFVYGILKRGFPADLTQHGATFLGKATIKGAKLLKINEGVGLRWSDDPLEVVHGEIFAIPDTLWTWLDAIEANGEVYTRGPAMARRGMGFVNVGDLISVQVYVHTYFAKAKYETMEKYKGGIYK